MFVVSKSNFRKNFRQFFVLDRLSLCFIHLIYLFQRKEEKLDCLKFKTYRKTHVPQVACTKETIEYKSNYMLIWWCKIKVSQEQHYTDHTRIFNVNFHTFNSFTPHTQRNARHKENERNNR